jgi:CheY-like chemotaxis protein
VAKVLVIESDSVFAAVLADRLHVAGHEVRRLSEGARAVAVAQEQQVDLVVLGTSPGAGLDVIEGLRGLPATRSLPILVLAAAADSVNALRTGADDVLTRPCDLEELLLRLYRLLANRTAVLQVLQGDLANHPLWALLQYLGQVRKTGILRVKATGGSGTLELRDGHATGARWQGLRGREALLALLSLEEGGFRFDPEPLPEAEEGPLPLHELLMQSAWLKDEIAKRRHLLPATGQPLQSLTPSLPSFEHDFHDLPLRRVFERVLQQPGLRLFDLIADETEAPPSTRLALALLVEVGAISPQTGEEDSDIQNTREISTVLLLEIAVEDLIDSATKAGLPATALPYLLLVEPEVWPALRRLVEEAPGFRRNEGMRKLVEQVELRKAGSVSFPGRRGKLSLHIQVITGAAQPQINAIVPGCAGLLVWIRGTGSLEVVGGVVQRLETSGPRGAGGVLVAGTEAAQQQAVALAGRGTRWRTTPHEPHSLLGLLRLLQPPDARA